MGLSCGAKVLKYCLFAFNLVFFVAGCICLGIGIFLIVDEHAMDKLIKATADEKGSAGAVGVRTLGVIMAVGGSIILLIAFLGCCGAVKEWRPLLVLYAICLMIILAVEIAAAIYAAVNLNNMEKLETAIKKILNETLLHYNGTYSKPSIVRETWDKYMNENDCCGVNGSATNEFRISGWYRDFSLRFDPEIYREDRRTYFPKACCKAEYRQTKWGSLDDPVCPVNYINRGGCYEIMRTGLEHKLAIVIGVGVAVGLIQLIGIIFSLCLCRSITDEYVVN